MHTCVLRQSLGQQPLMLYTWPLDDRHVAFWAVGVPFQGHRACNLGLLSPQNTYFTMCTWKLYSDVGILYIAFGVKAVCIKSEGLLVSAHYCLSLPLKGSYTGCVQCGSWQRAAGGFYGSECLSQCETIQISSHCFSLNIGLASILVNLFTKNPKYIGPLRASRGRWSAWRTRNATVCWIKKK